MSPSRGGVSEGSLKMLVHNAASSWSCFDLYANQIEHIQDDGGVRVPSPFQLVVARSGYGLRGVDILFHHQADARDRREFVAG